MFFEKWESYIVVHPTINDEILGTRRELKFDDWYVFIASQIEKSCLYLLKKDYIIKNNDAYNKGINF